MTFTAAAEDGDFLTQHYRPWLTLAPLVLTSKPRDIELRETSSSPMFSALCSLRSTAWNLACRYEHSERFTDDYPQIGEYKPMENRVSLYELSHALHQYVNFDGPMECTKSGVSLPQIALADVVAALIQRADGLARQMAATPTEDSWRMHEWAGIFLAKASTVMEDLDAYWDLRLTPQDVEQDLKQWFRAVKLDVQDDVRFTWLYLSRTVLCTSHGTCTKLSLPVSPIGQLDDYLALSEDSAELVHPETGSEALSKASKCLEQVSYGTELDGAKSAADESVSVLSHRRATAVAGQA